MSNFTYKTKTPANANSWIESLKVVECYYGNLRHYDEIHFTEPKKTQLAKNCQPHVTFIRHSFTNNQMVDRDTASAIVTHWYLVNVKGEYHAEAKGYSGVHALTFEGSFAQKVIDDAVELGWINQPLGKITVDDDGFSTKNSKRSQKTSWKK